MTLGEKITYLREKIPLYTKTQFAIDLKLTFPTMTRYENNERVPNIYTLIKMADIFKITLDDLIKDTDITTEVHATKIMQFYFKLKHLSDENIERLHHYTDYLVSTNVKDRKD